MEIICIETVFRRILLKCIFRAILSICTFSFGFFPKLSPNWVHWMHCKWLIVALITFIIEILCMGTIFRSILKALGTENDMALIMFIIGNYIYWNRFWKIRHFRSTYLCRYCQFYPFPWILAINWAQIGSTKDTVKELWPW